MNKIGKIISLALAAAVCAGSVSVPVLASDIEETAVNSENAVSIAAVTDFSIENYPYSFMKTFDDDSQIKDHTVWNESSKYKNPLSTRTSNPGFSFGPGYKGDAMILNFYSGHKNEKYGKMEESMGNTAQLSLPTKSETMYYNPTTGASVSLPLSEATVGTNKIAFWTKTTKNDTYDRQMPDYVSYTIKFSHSGSSEVKVKIPNDGQWHYIVADLSTPFGEGFREMMITAGCKDTFGSENEGLPVLKLDGKPGVYPLDKCERPIVDISDAYVLVDGEYVFVKTYNLDKLEYAPDPNGAFVKVVNDNGEAAYYRTDDEKYVLTVNSKGNSEYKVDDEGTYIYDIRTGRYIELSNIDEVLADRYTISSKIESYLCDPSIPNDQDQRVVDENGEFIPVEICGELVQEKWQQQIYIDEMLFYRTTESGGRTTFIPSGEEDLAYYANTDIDSVLIDGVTVFDVDQDGDRRVLTIPQDIDLSNPDLTRFQVTTKCPDVMIAAQSDGAFIPVDVSETGTIRSGSTASIQLPSTIGGKAVVTVTSALGTMQDYLFDVKWGYDLSVVSQGRDNGTVSNGGKSFTIQNYSGDDKSVQIIAVVKNKTTNELLSVVVSNAASGVIPANDKKTISFRLNQPGISSSEHSIYYYFVDSVTSMNQVVATIAVNPPVAN